MKVLKVLLKGVIFICSLGMGWLLGIYLLDWAVYWKVMLFYLICWGIGHIVYSLFRAIDKLFKNKSILSYSEKIDKN